MEIDVSKINLSIYCMKFTCCDSLVCIVTFIVKLVRSIVYLVTQMILYHNMEQR